MDARCPNRSARDFTSEQFRTVAAAPLPHFHTSPRPLPQSIDSATEHGILPQRTQDRKVLRTLRPTRFVCEAITFFEIYGSGVDEILLRIEISRHVPHVPHVRGEVSAQSAVSSRSAAHLCVRTH